MTGDSNFLMIKRKEKWAAAWEGRNQLGPAAFNERCQSLISSGHKRTSYSGLTTATEQTECKVNIISLQGNNNGSSSRRATDDNDNRQ